MSGSSAGNYTLTQPANMVATITPAALTVAGKTTSATYTASLQTNAAATVTGLVNGETLAVSGYATGTNVGTSADALTVAANPGTLMGNYAVTTSNGSLAITPASLTVSGTTIANGKTYDSNTAAVLTGGTLSGILGADAVTLNQIGVFASPNAATNIAVTAAETLSGSSAGNYTLTQPTALSATIAKAPLTVNNTVAADTIYNGTTTASLSGGTLSGVVAGEAVGLTQAGSYVSPNAGLRSISATDSLAGVAAVLSNYTLIQPTTLSATITKAALTVNNTVAADTIYNGTTVASLSGGTLSGVVAGETVGLTQAGSYESPNAGLRSITASDSLAGVAAVLSNYTLTQPTTLSATITKAPLTVIGVTAADKVYDSTTTVALSGAQVPGALVGLVAAETLSLSGQFDNAAVGQAKTVILSAVAASGDTGLVSNYSLSQPTGVSAIVASILDANAPPQAAVDAVVGGAYLAVQPLALSLSPTIFVTQSLTIDSVGNTNGGVTGTTATSKAPLEKDKVVSAANTRLTVNGTGPALQVVSGGILLPPELAYLNQ